MESYSQVIKNIVSVISNTSHLDEKATPHRAASCAMSNFYTDRPELDFLLSEEPALEESRCGAKVCSIWTTGKLTDEYRVHEVENVCEISLGNEERNRVAIGAAVDELGFEVVHDDRAFYDSESFSGDFSKHRERLKGRGGKDNHIAMLVRAWCTVLSGFWSEWIGDGRKDVPDTPAPLKKLESISVKSSDKVLRGVVNLTWCTEEETRWWLEVLSVDGPCHHVVSKGGERFYSPWDRPFECLRSITVIVEDSFDSASAAVNSSTLTGVRALERYVRRNGLQEQSWIALGIATWIPTMEQCEDICLPQPLHLIDNFAIRNGQGNGYGGSNKELMGACLIPRRNVLSAVFESLVWRPTVLKTFLYEVSDSALSSFAALEAIRRYWPYSAREERRVYDSWKSLASFPLAPLGYTGGRGWLASLISLPRTSEILGGFRAEPFFVARVWKTPWSFLHAALSEWNPGIAGSRIGIEGYISNRDELLLDIFTCKSFSERISGYKYPFPPPGAARVSTLPVIAQNCLTEWAASGCRLHLRLVKLSWMNEKNSQVPCTESVDPEQGVMEYFLQRADAADRRAKKHLQLWRGAAPEDFGCGKPLEQEVGWYENMRELTSQVAFGDFDLSNEQRRTLDELRGLSDGQKISKEGA